MSWISFALEELLKTSPPSVVLDLRSKVLNRLDEQSRRSLIDRGLLDLAGRLEREVEERLAFEDHRLTYWVVSEQDGKRSFCGHEHHSEAAAKLCAAKPPGARLYRLAEEGVSEFVGGNWKPLYGRKEMNALGELGELRELLRNPEPPPLTTVDLVIKAVEELDENKRFEVVERLVANLRASMLRAEQVKASLWRTREAAGV